MSSDEGGWSSASGEYAIPGSRLIRYKSRRDFDPCAYVADSANHMAASANQKQQGPSQRATGQPRASAKPRGHNHTAMGATVQGNQSPGLGCEGEAPSKKKAKSFKHKLKQDSPAKSFKCKLKQVDGTVELDSNLAAPAKKKLLRLATAAPAATNE